MFSPLHTVSRNHISSKKKFFFLINRNHGLKKYSIHYSPDNLFVVFNVTNIKSPDAPKIGVEKIFSADYDP